VYKQSKYIANIFVYGDSLQQYLVSIIVPNFENIAAWAKSKGLPEKPADLIKKPELLKLIQDDMKVIAAKEKLRGFEEVKKIRLHDQDFTVENDLLTPSMKLKRHQAKLRFKKEIDAMYAEKEDAKSKL
jgi:long-chain acyl-CoA synthetase